METIISNKITQKFWLTGLILVFFLGSCAVSKQSRNQKTSVVVTQARSYIGTPYKYGGTTIMGMDCSGLLMRSFEYVDLYIPRTSHDQSKMGKPVSVDMLRPGDLVFFSSKKGRNRVSHAGLVTEIRGKDEIMFVHASSSRGVVEDNLMSRYYQSVFVKARRVRF